MIIDAFCFNQKTKKERIENLILPNPNKKKVSSDEITVAIFPIFQDFRMQWAVRKPNFIKNRELEVVIRRDTHHRRLHALSRKREKTPKRLNFRMYS
jgi:hypothetical protein